MWRPDEVVPRHKRRAVAVWILLILSIVAYSSYLIFMAVRQMENPNTSFELSNKIYRYPDLSMCLYDYYGCDHRDLEEECAASANSTAGGLVNAIYHIGGEDEQEIPTEYVLTDKKGWCVVFKTSEVVAGLGTERDPDNYLDYIILDMYWYPGGSANNSSTCISEEGEWKEHSESIFGFLNDTETGQLSTGIQVPYTCMTNESTSYTYTSVGIGLTQTKNLDAKDDTYSYKSATQLSATYKIERNENITGIESPYAYIRMKFYQHPDSLEIITEINPLAIAEVFGSVGGFWDLLMIFWPIFFVASSRQGPQFKFRNFKKSLAKVKEGAANTVKSSLPNQTLSQAGALSALEAQEEVPDWDRASCERPKSVDEGDEVIIRLFDEHGLVAVVNGGRVKKFLKSEFHAKSLKDGATEPVLQKLLPAKTYLVVVPPGETGSSVARTVAAYCRSGGDSVETFDAKPISVKAKRAHCSGVQAQALSASSYVAVDDDIGDESDIDLDVAERKVPDAEPLGVPTACGGSISLPVPALLSADRSSPAEVMSPRRKMPLRRHPGFFVRETPQLSKSATLVDSRLHAGGSRCPTDHPA